MQALGFAEAGVCGVEFRDGARADAGGLSELLGKCGRTALVFNDAGGLLLDNSSGGFEGFGEAGLAVLPGLPFGSAAGWWGVRIIVGVEIRLDGDVIRAEGD